VSHQCLVVFLLGVCPGPTLHGRHFARATPLVCIFIFLITVSVLEPKRLHSEGTSYLHLRTPPCKEPVSPQGHTEVLSIAFFGGTVHLRHPG
jgi:hypothetical protein